MPQVTIDDVANRVSLSKKQYENRKTKMLSNLEKQRKALLDKDFQPNADWWNSKVTKN